LTHVEFHECGALVTVDVEATRRMYALIDHGQADDCTCEDCAYFSTHRSQAYPQEFVDLLERLGIDAAKENEVWSLEQTDGCEFHGNFDFVGTVQLEPPRQFKYYSFVAGAGYPWTEKRALELGFGPIAHVRFKVWLAATFPGSPKANVKHSRWQSFKGILSGVFGTTTEIN
jgi:hypothetical protein